MNTVIWKYVMPNSTIAVMSMPAGAKVIHCGVQYGATCFWAEVNPDAAETEERKFKIVGTGFAELRENMEYIGTAMTENQMYVWHLYEVKDSDERTDK